LEEKWLQGLFTRLVFRYEMTSGQIYLIIYSLHLDEMSEMTLIQMTRKGYGKNTPEEKQQKDLFTLDNYENFVSV